MMINSSTTAAAAGNQNNPAASGAPQAGGPAPGGETDPSGFPRAAGWPPLFSQVFGLADPSGAGGQAAATPDDGGADEAETVTDPAGQGAELPAMAMPLMALLMPAAPAADGVGRADTAVAAAGLRGAALAAPMSSALPASDASNASNASDALAALSTLPAPAQAAAATLLPGAKLAPSADAGRASAATLPDGAPAPAMPPADLPNTSAVTRSEAPPAAASLLAGMPHQPAAPVARPGQQSARPAALSGTAAASAGAVAPAPEGGVKNVKPEAGAITLPTPAAPGPFATVMQTAGDNPGDGVKLAGPPAQWQQPLQDALGDRLQVQLLCNAEHATIRLEPPMLGRIDISIRHAGGALQVHLSASNGDVLRQLQAIGENVRQDLSQRQFGEVSVSVTATPRSAAFAEGDARGRQSGRQAEQNEPGRALSDSEVDKTRTPFALHEREKV
ncbi:MAG: flagellar hook-length control protein FliK [Pseudomonadota bacterium]